MRKKVVQANPHIRKRMLILCEDKKSSLLYFKSFKIDEDFQRTLYSVNIEVYKSKDNSPAGLLNDALERRRRANRERNPYNGGIWIVFDKDIYKQIDDTIKKAEVNGINWVLSVICFEIWVLLHFKLSSKPFEYCDELVKELRKYYPEYDKGKCCFNDLKELMPTAISNAEWLEKQNQSEIDRGTHICDLSAYTNIHHLVKILINK